MDHEAMRGAYLRALEYNKEDYTSFCNDCKSAYVSDTGEFVDLVTVDKLYKLWYCSPCVEKQEEVLV
jgi:hypothetical protein